MTKYSSFNPTKLLNYVIIVTKINKVLFILLLIRFSSE